MPDKKPLIESTDVKLSPEFQKIFDSIMKMPLLKFEPIIVDYDYPYKNKHDEYQRLKQKVIRDNVPVITGTQKPIPTKELKMADEKKDQEEKPSPYFGKFSPYHERLVAEACSDLDKKFSFVLIVQDEEGETKVVTNNEDIHDSINLVDVSRQVVGSRDTHKDIFRRSRQLIEKKRAES